MSYTIGIDSSTTATKALLMSEAGEVIAVGRSEYAYESPRPLWAEQDPELWWEATHAAIREVLATAGVAGASVKAVGLTGQMHGLVGLDANQQVVRNAILWNDQRTQAECDAIIEAYSFLIAGCLHSTFAFSQLLIAGLGARFFMKNVYQVLYPLTT